MRLSVSSGDISGGAAISKPRSTDAILTSRRQQTKLPHFPIKTLLFHFLFLYLYILYYLLYLVFSFQSACFSIAEKTRLKCFNIYFISSGCQVLKVVRLLVVKGALSQTKPSIYKINNVEEHQSSNENA